MNPDHDHLLKRAILEVVENQISGNDPPETRKTLSRLMKSGYSRKKAVEMLGSVVAVEIFEVLKANQPFDRKRLISALNELE
ncbi:MAG: hypothetical protein ACTSRU_12185 [Candidatus Hodarchaeales archaeon]